MKILMNLFKLVIFFLTAYKFTKSEIPMSSLFVIFNVLKNSA
jgi:hypothetical protein